MEEKIGVLDKFEVTAKVATDQMWDDISNKVYDGEDARLGTHHWEGCPLPMIPTVEFMDDGTNLLIVTKEGYEAYKSAHADDVIIANCNGINGTYDMVKNDIDVVYVVPEEFIIEYNASKEEREAFIKEQQDKRKELGIEKSELDISDILNHKPIVIEEEKIDDETKKKFLRTLPDEIVPDKSDEALKKIIESEKINTLNNGELDIRFGESVSIIRTSDVYEYRNDYDIDKYSYDGKKIEKISYENNQYNYKSDYATYDENGDLLYSKTVGDFSDGLYYNTLYIASGKDSMYMEHGIGHDYSDGYEEYYYYDSRFTVDGKDVSAIEYLKAHPELEVDIIEQMEDAWNFTRKHEIKELKQELDEIVDYMNAKSELTDLVDKDKKLDKKLDKANELLQDYQALNGQDAPSLDGDENE